MSEDERSTATKNIRILIVANPGDSDSSSDEDKKSSHAESSSRSHGYSYHPPPLPSTTNRSPQGARPIPPHAPSPLKTNLPLDKGHHSQSSYSNPTLSSPSSTSSPAVDTTPPPSTPGFSAPALDLPADVSVKQEPLIGSSSSDGHIATRAAHIFDKIKHLTHRSSPQRTSGGSFLFNTSPTASIPESSPTNTRPILSDKLLLMVTTDGDQYLTVEISGPKSAAIIRERIFTRLHVSDEDQAHYSIYRTKLGGFAIGDALTDEQLLSLCRDRGDEALWFFVSHSSAPVHEMSSQSSASVSPTVSTIPPPILPLQNGVYGLLRPRSRSKHGSVSSASERLPPEVGAGYEASVSDDLDIGERDSNRSTMRAAPSRSTVSAYKNYPSSPDRGRRPSVPHTRPMSPLSTMRPSSPPPRDQGLEAPCSRADKYGSITPTPPPAPPPQSLSPTSATFHDNALTQPLQKSRHTRSGSDAAAEREQVLQASEDQIEQASRQWQHYRQKDESRGKLDRIRDKYGSPVKTRGQRSKRSADVDESSDKLGQSDSWVVIGNETPRAGSKSGSSSQDTQRASPSILKDRTRGPNYLPYTQTGSSYGGRLTMPKAGRNPPPPPTVGTGEQRPSSSRTTAQAPLPANWAVTWKVPDKTDQKSLPVSTPQWSRLTAKSMNDLRNTSHNGIPMNLQPGSRPATNLPITRPERREGVSIPTTSYTDGPSSGRDLTGSNVPGLPKSYDTHRAPPRPLPKQGSSSQSSSLNTSQSPPKTYGAWVAPLQPPPNNYSTLVSPSSDAMPRPQSAMGNAPQRYQSRNYSTDQDDIDTISPHPSSPLRQGGIAGRLGIGRDESSSSSQSTHWHGLRSGSYPSMLPSEAHGGSEMHRTPPRTPTSPRSPRHSANSSLAEPFNRPFAPLADKSLPTDVEESVNSNETVRPEDHGWIRRMLDGDSAGSATLIPKLVDIGQSPVPTQPTQPPPPPPPPSQSQTDSFPATSYNPSQSTLIAEEDSESEDDDDLWQTKPTRSPRIKSICRDKAFTRGPQLTVQTEKILPPSFQNTSSFKGSDYAQGSSRPAADPPLSLRKLASLTPDSGKNRQRGSTFTDNEYTWAPRPAPEEVYERLEEFFPEHDLDKPVIEASSGSGSPTITDNPAVPPLADKDRPEKALVRAKKSIRIVAEEHKKRIDRTSRAENLASVLRKRSTKLWGSRLEEVTTEQAKAEQARALYAKTAPESPSGGPRPIFKWVRGELIGKGTYGRVYLALNATTGEMIAVKQVEIPQTASDKNDSRQAVYVKALKSESETLKDLDHPNVVQYLGFEETPNFLSIFLEYVPGGSIGSCLLKHGKFDEEVTKSFTEQILTGLEYLHSQGILHRDLKADNILVETTGICKISDFGISKRTDNINGIGASTAMQGTVFWMAPEVIDTPKKGYDKKIDIWSVGCVVLEMWAGKRPWSGTEEIAVILKLHKSKLPPPVPDDIALSSLAQNFYNQCFAVNPEERPTAAALRKHPYLTLPPDWVFNGFKSEH